ncbi:DUF2442 domain-containing protein [Gemmatimonas sp.]|uniref:DUF2442 domain-containing protein n=1 Tax=Gemmatimonas sp. TaxID=1962908 RepID=UPI00286D1C0E|nr:DUF2442 domain-containing protein [Gemmatimonas sp.]
MFVVVPAILHITDARVVFSYRLWLRFNDGAEGVADLRDDLEAPVFEPLKDPADVAPEFLRPRSTTASAD